jgi:DNA-binding NtrC family response regulator
VCRDEGVSGNSAKPRFESRAGIPYCFSTNGERHSHMDQSASVKGNPASVLRHRSGERIPPTLAQPTVLVATVDSVISDSMRELLQNYPLRTIWAKGVEEVRAVLASEDVGACFCGFWLVDGTYRDVVRLLKRQPVEVPAIIVCAPACPHEYRDYLAALNIRAFDFICHPYRKSDFEQILRRAISERCQSAEVQSSVGNPTNDLESQSGLRKAG